MTNLLEKTKWTESVDIKWKSEKKHIFGLKKGLIWMLVEKGLISIYHCFLIKILVKVFLLDSTFKYGK